MSNVQVLVFAEGGASSAIHRALESRGVSHSLRKVPETPRLPYFIEAIVDCQPDIILFNPARVWKPLQGAMAHLGSGQPRPRLWIYTSSNIEELVPSGVLFVADRVFEWPRSFLVIADELRGCVSELS